MSKVITYSVVVLLVLSVIAFALSAVGDVNQRSDAPATALASETTTADSSDENAAVRAFKWV